VIYALRKLIAFVFLGGMFWFIYQDLDNLNQPWFMHALGMITVAFAFFWLLIPMVVVCVRIRRRRAQNAERHRKWLAEGGAANIRPRPAKSARIAVAEPDEQIFFHEKGTLYVGLGAPGFDSAAHQSRPTGRPSDVAFPGFRRVCHVCQRTHCYITSRRMAFEGKDLDMAVPFSELGKCSVMPGGIVFEAGGATSMASFAFTFQNPLIAVDILRFAKGD